jgi:hypothetical protein
LSIQRGEDIGQIETLPWRRTRLIRLRRITRIEKKKVDNIRVVSFLQSRVIALEDPLIGRVGVPLE